MALEREAQQEGIPIVGPVVGELLYILSRATGTRTILELGTAKGYSTIYLARACQSVKGRVITVDCDRDMAVRAKTNLEKCGLAHLVEIRIGDAIDLMPSMDGPFDLIFMDIDKEYYASALPHCLRLLRIGGLLIPDNVGFQSADTFNREIFW